MFRSLRGGANWAPETAEAASHVRRERPLSDASAGTDRIRNLLGQKLQNRRHPHKHDPDGGIDGWISWEESLSHLFCSSGFIAEAQVYTAVARYATDRLPLTISSES